MKKLIEDSKYFKIYEDEDKNKIYERKPMYGNSIDGWPWCSCRRPDGCCNFERRDNKNDPEYP